MVVAEISCVSIPTVMIDLQQLAGGAAEETEASSASVLFEPLQRKNRTRGKKQSIRNRNQQVRLSTNLTN